MKIDIGAQEHNHDAEEEDDLGSQTLRGVFGRQLDENDGWQQDTDNIANGGSDQSKDKFDVRDHDAND